jgi:hypothetical protein
VAEKVSETLIKLTSSALDSLDLKKLNKAEHGEQYHAEISNAASALETLNGKIGYQQALKNIR